FYVIQAALDSDFAGEGFLCVIAMLTALISAFMYLKIVAAMYFGDPVDAEAPRIRIPAAAGVALAISVLGVMVLGVVPGPLSDFVGNATAQLVAVGR
ncbi:MAG: NADH:ubiquinone oxidoreductase subunit N, partial [Actinobacteria bacterium]|nr:NADH:ubiquinone oxidoreductase subunit N [Actinomycetota bacterium]